MQRPLIVLFSVETAKIYADGLYFEIYLAISPLVVKTMIVSHPSSKLIYTAEIAMDSTLETLYFYNLQSDQLI